MKKRINVMMDNEDIRLLNQAEKLNPQKTNRSKLISYAIRKTYQNREEALREQMKENKREFMRMQDEMKTIKEEK